MAESLISSPETLLLGKQSNEVRLRGRTEDTPL